MENKTAFRSLRSTRDFESLRKDGRYFHPARWLMVSYKLHDRGEVRCAWTISRHIAPAVIRNRLKRWGREFFRKWSMGWKGGVDFNLIFKRQDLQFYRELAHADFNQVLRKVVDRFEKASS